MKMKKIVSIITVLCFVFSCISVMAVGGAGSAKLSISASDTNVKVGDSFDLTVKISGDTPVFSYHLSGTYD